MFRGLLPRALAHANLGSSASQYLYYKVGLLAARLSQYPSILPGPEHTWVHTVKHK